MPVIQVVQGATSVSCNIFVRDSSSGVGAGLGAVAPAGGSLLTGTKLDYSFTGANAARVNVSLSVLATVGTAYTSGGIVTLDNTNMIGWVRIDIPNAALAGSTNRMVSFLLWNGTNMAPTAFSIELQAVNNQSATAFITGVNSLAPPTNWNAMAITAAGGVAPDWANVKSPTTTVGLTGTTISSSQVVASVSGAVGSVTGLTASNLDTTVSSRLAPTVAARTLDVSTTGEAGLDFDNVKQATGATTLTNIRVPNVTLTDTVTTYTGDTPQTGDAFARLGAPAGASVSADILEANNDLDELITTVGVAGAGLTAIPDSSTVTEIGADVDELIVTVGVAGAGLTAIPDSSAVTEIGADVDELITTIGVAGAGLTNIDLPDQTMNITGNITGNLSGSVGSVTGNVGGTVVGLGIRKNVALAKFEFLMTDSTTHLPATGKTVTVTRSIDNGAFGAGTLSAVTEISSGIYSVDFGAADLNGGVITLKASATGCDTTFATIIPDT